MKKRVHQNSVDARQALIDILTGRQADVFAWFRRSGLATDRDCMTGLGFKDMNAVRPRITELIGKGLLEQHGDRPEAWYGRTVKVRLVRVAPMPGVQGALFDSTEKEVRPC